MTAVEQVHALWSAYESGGVLASLAHVDEDCEWIPSPDLPATPTVRGVSEMRAYFERIVRDGVRLEPSLHTCEAVGDDVVVVGGRMRVVSSAALSDAPLFWVYRTTNGRVRRVESYPTRCDALTAAAAAAPAPARAPVP